MAMLGFTPVIQETLVSKAVYAKECMYLYLYMI